VAGADTLDVVFEVDFQSFYGSGWGVGDLHLTYSPTGGDPWSDLAWIDLVTTVPAGSVNYAVSESEDRTIAAGYYRLQWNAGFGQTQVEPYPFEAMRIRVYTKEQD
jgi:hypothetical protein